MRGVRTRCALVLAAAQMVGCYRWVEIRPTELPKLNEESSDGRKQSREALLERPDGSLLQIGRNADVRVTTSRSVENFEAPVVAKIDEADLSVRAADRGKTTFPLTDVKRVELSKLDKGATAGVIVAGSVGALVLATLAVVAVASSIKSNTPPAGSSAE